MRQRDLGVLFICAVAIFISFQQDAGDGFRIRRAWFFPLDVGLYDDGNQPQPWEKVPPPVIVEGADGSNDVVLVTKEPKVKILDRGSLNVKTSKKADFKVATETREATLLSSIIRLTTGRQPAALAVGYIDQPPKDPITLRKKVVVVVTQDWTVLCFDEKLRLMWETSLQDFVPDGFFHREIAINITPIGVFRGDRGMIIIGGSTNHELTFGGDEEPDDPTEEADTFENPQDELLIEQDIHHFSYYAVEGGRGGLRWSHEAGDYETTIMDDENNLSPQHNYKLDVQGNEQHQDEVDWRQYRESVLTCLPHSWRRRDDTWMELKHFTKQRGGGPKAGPAGSAAGHSLLTAAQSAAEVLDHHVGSGSVQTRRGGSRFGPVSPPPNVIVAHRADGLDVVHLFSGRVLCQVKLMQGVHVDVNRDGSIDHVYSLAGHNFASRSAHDKLAAAFAASSDAVGAAPQPGCMIMATSGVPVRDHLFNASACHAKKDRNLKGVAGDWARSKDALDGSEPVVVPSVNSPGKLDTIFLLSNGRMTSVGPNGEVNWQTQTSATWRKEHVVLATGSDHAAALRTDSVIVGSLTVCQSPRFRLSKSADLPGSF